MATIAAIDPGKKGAIAILENGTIQAHPLPLAGKELDLVAIADELREHNPTILVIEKVGARPGNGSVSMFSFGRAVGSVEGIAAALKVEIREVEPKAWQEATTTPLKGTAIGWCQSRYPKVRGFFKVPRTPRERNRMQCKAASIMFAGLNFPAVPLIPKRHTAPHDGIADAVCLLEYARRSLVG